MNLNCQWDGVISTETSTCFTLYSFLHRIRWIFQGIMEVAANISERGKWVLPPAAFCRWAERRTLAGDIVEQWKPYFEQLFNPTTKSSRRRGRPIKTVKVERLSILAWSTCILSLCLMDATWFSMRVKLIQNTRERLYVLYCLRTPQCPPQKAVKCRWGEGRLKYLATPAAPTTRPWISRNENGMKNPSVK